MNLSFTNGTQEQQSAVAQALNSLLNLDLDRFGFSLLVTFAADPSDQFHNEFATTTPGQPTELRIRNDFPHFSGPEWGSAQFALETVAHELGHALTAQLSSEDQEALATLFSTTVTEWNPDDRPWQDRPYEGIAETFKDAFIPQDLRAYANRTNHRIPIDRYPDFRRIYRRATGTASDPIQFLGPGVGVGTEQDLFRADPHPVYVNVFGGDDQFLGLIGSPTNGVGGYMPPAHAPLTFTLPPDDDRPEDWSLLVGVNLADTGPAADPGNPDFLASELTIASDFSWSVNDSVRNNLEGWIVWDVDEDTDGLHVALSFPEGGIQHPVEEPDRFLYIISGSLSASIVNTTVETFGAWAEGYWNGHGSIEPEDDPPAGSVAGGGQQTGTLRTRRKVSGSVL